MERHVEVGIDVTCFLFFRSRVVDVASFKSKGHVECYIEVLYVVFGY